MKPDATNHYFHVYIKSHMGGLAAAQIEQSYMVPVVGVRDSCFGVKVQAYIPQVRKGHGSEGFDLWFSCLK